MHTHCKPLIFPGIGMRNIKTALAASICALIYYFLDRSPAFACIGAIFGMGSDMNDSRKNGGNRLFGTLIGGVLGIILFRIYLVFRPEGGHTLWLVPLTFIGTVLLILLCQMFWVGGVQPGGVVLCILLFNTPVDTYVSYALNRILDTAVGVMVAWGISYFFPRGWMPIWRHNIQDWQEHHAHWGHGVHRYMSHRSEERAQIEENAAESR